MRTTLFAATSLLALLGGCATTTSMPEVKPIERMVSATPQTAEQLAAQGLYSRAAASYQASLNINPDDATARFGFAEVLRKGGKPDDAAKEYGKLLTNDEWKTRALEGVGQSRLASGDQAAARDAFVQVVADDEKAWKSWLGLAQIHDFAKEWAQADEAYAHALASTTQPALIYNNQGLSHLARGETQWAIEHFRLALSTDPTMKRAQTNLEMAEAAAGESLQKVSSSERDAKERARKLNNAGYVAMLQDRPEDARAFYQAALEEHPSFYPQAYQNLQSLNAAKSDTTAPDTDSAPQQ